MASGGKAIEAMPNTLDTMPGISAVRKRAGGGREDEGCVQQFPKTSADGFIALPKASPGIQMQQHEHGLHEHEARGHEQ